MFFTNKHSCVVGSDHCIFAHQIRNLREYERGSGIEDWQSMSLFKNLSIWVTTYILSFLSNHEILKFWTVNKEARNAC